MYKNVYIVADVEGVAGLVFYEFWDKEMSLLNHELLHRNRVLLTEEVNAAARGAFAAGAEKVVVHDHHGAGYTIIPELMDERLELIHGRNEQHIFMGSSHPDLDQGFDALVLIGMHAKAGTVAGCTPHSYIYVETEAGKTYALSEATMSMAVAGDCGIPCAFIAGDRATVEDALTLSPGMDCLATKKNYASQLTRTISPILSRKLIEAGVQEALLKGGLLPFKIFGPCTVRIGDRNPQVLWPDKPEKCPTFTAALSSTLQNVPWYKPVTAIDDGWRFPDRRQAMPPTQWNVPTHEQH